MTASVTSTSGRGSERTEPREIPTVGLRLRRTLRQYGPELFLVAASLELSAAYIPIAPGRFVVDGRALSLLDAGKLSLVGLIAALALASTEEDRRSFFAGVRTIYFFLAYVVAITVLRSLSVGLAEIIRLSALLTLFALTASIRRDWIRSDTLARCSRLVIGWGIALALIAVAQRLGGFYLWNHDLAASGRANATFADPNHLARYLVVSLALLPLARWRWTLAPAALLIAGIAATGSRAGILSVGIVSIAGTVLARGWTKRYYATLLVGGLALVPMAWSGLQRLTVDLGAGSAGRTTLIADGIEAWENEPVFGCGLRCFPSALSEEATLRLDRYHEGLRESHTAFVTALVELGILGSVLLLAVIAWPLVSSRTRRGATPLVIGLVAIFVLSNTEGRLLEEPLLWYLLAMALAYRTSVRPQPAVAPRFPEVTT